MGVFCTQTKINPILETQQHLVPTQEALQVYRHPTTVIPPHHPRGTKALGIKAT